MATNIENATTVLEALDKRIETDLQTGVRTTSLAMVRTQIGAAIKFLKIE